MMTKEVTAVVAAAFPSRGIGYQGQMPWKLPADLKHFQQVTQGGIVIMGRKTWDSLPVKFRPLPGRTNVIITRHPQHLLSVPDPNVLLATSWTDALQQSCNNTTTGHPKMFVIGGAEIYQQALDSGSVNRVLVTQIENLPPDTKFDTFFPELDPTLWTCQPFGGGTVNKENEHRDDEFGGFHVDPNSGIRYRFVEYHKVIPNVNNNSSNNEEEMQYLHLCRKILDHGVSKGDRTGTGTLSLFGTHMRFSLRNHTLPLLTTKKVFWKGVAEELLWFISGTTNANTLAAKGVHIWDGNGSRDFLDQRGLHHREVGDLGPVYGFQWRHFGATYVDMHTDYSGQGVDQLAQCIDKIRNHPDDRRIILSAWNPSDLDSMALPPCHMFCQFYVDTTKNELSCQMYQRSADMGLGVPFNIASYALLTHMIAHVTGRQPGDLIHTIGDAHIYLNHVDALREQLKRAPRPFPKIKINPEKKDIDDFVYSDFEVIDYNPLKTIKMKMAV